MDRLAAAGRWELTANAAEISLRRRTDFANALSVKPRSFTEKSPRRPFYHLSSPTTGVAEELAEFLVSGWTLA